MKDIFIQGNNFILKFQLVKLFILRCSPSPSKLTWLLNQAGNSQSSMAGCVESRGGGEHSATPGTFCRSNVSATSFHPQYKMKRN